MKIASQLRRTNIAQYLLYMWQVEDLLRAYDLDIDRLAAAVINPVPDLSEEDARALREWYESLIDMMRREGVAEKGHLQITRNTLGDLADLHRRILAEATRFPEYTAEFYRTLPYIVELRAKSGPEPAGEIETCFNALYARLILRLRHADESAETAAAIDQITRFIAALARDYHLDEADKLFTPEEDAPADATPAKDASAKPQAHDAGDAPK